ncbi:major facilitator superfamily domain-containing protein [Trametes polyzona]|nr:major facilitator superfamily domain-containing protein [Trametes polyzona]
MPSPHKSCESPAQPISPPVCPVGRAQDCEKAIEVEVSPTAPTQYTIPLQRAKTRLASAFFAYFVLGWGDGDFKKDLQLSFVLSSLFWVASASGYALGTITVEHVTRVLGRTRYLRAPLPSVFAFPMSKTRGNQETTVIGFSRSRSRFFTMLIASILHALFFVLMGSKRGFASMMIAYVISAFARNVYVPSVSKGGLGFLYGFTSVGSFVAPLVCQSIVATGIRWANFYFGSLVLSALNACFVVYAFRPTVDELKGDADLAWELYKSTATARSDATSSVAAMTSVSPATSTAPILRKKDVLGPRCYMAAVKNLQTWASAAFACIYSGSESATQGFIVVYLLNTRHANPNTVGYVTSGFWGGMAVSRFAWGYLGRIISFRQRKWIVQACIVLPIRSLNNSRMLPLVIALVMHLLILLVPSFVENAVSTAMIGMLYGPIFPSNLATVRDLLPPELHLVSLAIVAALASIGAAIFPFIAGLLTTIVGAYTLPYITIAQTVAMFCLWFLFPSRPTSDQ